MLRAWLRGSRGVEYTDSLQSPGCPPGQNSRPQAWALFPGATLAPLHGLGEAHGSLNVLVRVNRPRHPCRQTLGINAVGGLLFRSANLRLGILAVKQLKTGTLVVRARVDF